MLQLLFPKSGWGEAAGACVLHVLHVCGVKPLVYAVNTVWVRVTHVALAVCQVVVPVLHMVYVEHTFHLH
jgi:hypothetical protein